jgi:hypothetical protein
VTGTTDATSAPGPREIFARWQQLILGNDPDALGELYAEEIVVEAPFAPPGHPRRLAGREQNQAFSRPRRAALPARFEEFRNVVIHDTADPGVIVAEYELCGTVTTTGQPGSAPFVVILRVRNGRIVHWREYQDALGMAVTLGQLPALLAGLTPGG